MRWGFGCVGRDDGGSWAAFTEKCVGSTGAKGCYRPPVTQVVAMTVVDDVALAFSLLNLSVVFVRLRRAYKRKSPDSDVNETAAMGD